MIPRQLTANGGGSEIERAFVEALYLAFSEGKEPTDLTIARVINDYSPALDSIAVKTRA